MLLKNLLNAHIKQTINPCLKAKKFKCYSQSGTFWFVRIDNDKGIKDFVAFENTRWLSRPTFQKTYEVVQDIITPIIGKYHNDYLNNDDEATITFRDYESDLLEYKDMIMNYSDEDDFFCKVDLLKEYILNRFLPLMEKFNDLAYLEKFMREMKAKDNYTFWCFLGSVRYYQFHGFKRMAICKLVNVPDFEEICLEEFEFIKGLHDWEPENEKYMHLVDIYNDLKKYLDEL